MAFYDDDDEEESVGLLVLDELIETFGSPGRILAGAKTKSLCKCVTVQLDEGPKKICTRKGIVGTLSQDQVAERCSTTKEVADGRRERIAVLRATGSCKREVGDLAAPKALDNWLDCVGDFLHREGVDIRGKPRPKAG